MKRLFLICIFLLFSQSVFASRTFVFNGPTNYVSGAGDPSCSFIIDKLSTFKDVKCIGLDAAVKRAVTSQGSQQTFQVTGSHKVWGDSIGPNGGPETGVIAMSGGSCKAGTPAGTVEVPMFYTVNGEKVQTIRTASEVSGSIAGCQVQGVGTDGTGVCVGFPKPGTNATLMTCGVEMQETGQDGGADGTTDSDPGYNGSTTPETGGGTTPGGGTGGGETGGGTTPGGSTGGGSTGGGGMGGGTGGGTTPGGSTGGGETGGGTTPGGGTGGGTGGGSGGSGSSCGAPGQSPCKIDESGTPDGKGLFDDLMKMVEGLGPSRKDGLGDASSDEGKNTSPGISGFNLPTGSCVDPTVSVPGGGPTFTVEICKYVAMIAVGFEALWVIVFALACMAMVSRATAKPVA